MADGLYFTKEHEWVRIAGDVGTVGISDFAQGQLGDVVFVELPDVGKSFNRGDAVAVVESVKAASDIYSPMSGEVIEVNGGLPDEPALVNSAPLGAGWFFKLRLSAPDERAGLLSEAEYRAYVEEQG